MQENQSNYIVTKGTFMCNDFTRKRKMGENREISQTSQCLQFTKIKKMHKNKKKCCNLTYLYVQREQSCDMSIILI